MDDQEHRNRVEALANAVRHRLREETPEEVVKAAEMYYRFLQGNQSASD